MPAELEVGDELGPAKIVHVHEPEIGLRGTLVVDNVAAGPSIGGLRMAADVTTAECLRLARAMTLKNAAAGLPHGGGKSVIRSDPGIDAERKQALVRAMACALADLRDYIFGPDMGTDETCMAWVLDEIGRAVGLPRELGGIPLDQIGATGFGVALAADVAARAQGFELAGARVVIQGFGSVGRHAARFLLERGAVLVGVADSRGAISSPKGLDLAALTELKSSGRSVAEHLDAEVLERDAVVGIPCDIFVPAARPDVIDAANVDTLSARLVVPGANIPMTDDAAAALHRRGVLCVPDFIANAGGVICAALEYRGATESQVFAQIEATVRENTAQVIDRSRRDGMLPAAAAHAMSVSRVKAAMRHRRWSIF